jgi:hypothetical protein
MLLMLNVFRIKNIRLFLLYLNILYIYFKKKQVHFFSVSTEEKKLVFINQLGCIANGTLVRCHLTKFAVLLCKRYFVISYKVKKNKVYFYEKVFFTDSIVNFVYCKTSTSCTKTFCLFKHCLMYSRFIWTNRTQDVILVFLHFSVYLF